MKEIWEETAIAAHITSILPLCPLPSPRSAHNSPHYFYLHWTLATAKSVGNATFQLGVLPSQDTEVLLMGQKGKTAVTAGCITDP